MFSFFRCDQGDQFTECCLCNLRGGALKPIYDGNEEKMEKKLATTTGQWAHVICALFNVRGESLEFNFEDPQRMKIVAKGLSKEVQLAEMKFACGAGGGGALSTGACVCAYCRSCVGKTVICSVPGCETTFHVTCGYEAGCGFEIREYPILLAAVCVAHNGPGITVEATKRIFSIEEKVIALRSDGIYALGTIAETGAAKFCVIDFDDGSFSDNTFNDDIVYCDCQSSCQGVHRSGAHVKVKIVQIFYSKHTLYCLSCANSKSVDFI